MNSYLNCYRDRVDGSLKLVASSPQHLYRSFGPPIISVEMLYRVMIRLPRVHAIPKFDGPVQWLEYFGPLEL